MENTTQNPYEFDILFYIGRFQPLHLGHQSVIDQALELSKHVVVMVGSANIPISYKNPWTYEDREEMIRSSYEVETNEGKLFIRPLDDVLYDDNRWLAQVQKSLSDIASIQGDPEQLKIGIIGHEKDSSSYYLKLFPTWEMVEVPMWGTVSSTNIRENFFQSAPIIPDHLCGSAVVNFLKGYMLGSEFKYILEERKEIERKYFEPWKNSPYTPHFVTADAVVTQAGHILLVTRGEAPGKGLLALPGGHIDPSVGDAYDNCIKELWEEARPSDGHSRRGKAMPKNRLRGFFTGEEKRFDAPGRDQRGYYCTHAFRFKFPDDKLWDVTGGLSIDGETNDVVDAAWYPIGSLDPKRMFADHYFIIQQML